jgi:hypothetical protein
MNDDLEYALSDIDRKTLKRVLDLVERAFIRGGLRSDSAIDLDRAIAHIKILLEKRG